MIASAPARRTALAAFLLLGTSAGCARIQAMRGHAPAPEPAAASAPRPASEWPGTLRAAQAAARTNDFARADSLLRAFSERHTGSAESAEAAYWRGLLFLDPASPGSSTRLALTELEAYRAGGNIQPRFTEATTLRRLALHLDSLRAALSTARTAAATLAAAGTGMIARDSVRTRDEELARLRTELDQTKAELDRIRRRLAAPRP